MTLENTLRWIVLGGIFALPFIVFLVTTSLFFPFITGKNFAFRILVEVVTGAYLVLALANVAYRPRRNWLLGAFALFVIIVALADAFGAYPFKSFWSNFERMDGWVTLSHLFFLFVVASSVLNTEKLWRAFWQTSLFASAVMGVHALFQLLGIASLNPGFSSTARLDATFGNPIYLAVYMLFHVAVALLLITQSGRERWNTPERIVVGCILAAASAIAIAHFGASGWMLYVLLLALIGLTTFLVFLQRVYLLSGILILNTFILFMTGTRGAMLGLVGGIVLGALLLALSSREMRRVAVAIVAGFVVLLGAFWLVRGEAWLSNVPFLQRLAAISLEDSTTRARFMNWGMAWEGVSERPILGWGQENYAVVFDKYYNPQMYGQEQWFDRVHNVVFDWLVAAGFLGLLSYLSLFVLALWMLWRRTVESVFSPLERSILTGLLAAYFFHNLFVFDNIGSYLLFALILAYIAWRGARNAEPIPMPHVSQKMLPIAAACAVVLVWGAVWYVNARPLSANLALLEALKPHQEGLEKNLEYLKESISYGTVGVQEAREQLSQVTAQLARTEGLPASVKQAFLETAAQEMILQAADSPLNARAPLFLGVLLNTYGNFENAAAALERAHELSPGKQTILFELAANHMARGDLSGALERYREAYELAPEFSSARLFYAAAAIRAERDDLAEELLAPILADGGAADARIAAAYVARDRYDKIVPIWEAYIKADPQDAQAYLTLAAAYYGMGNSTRAISVLENLGSIVPEAKQQADALIQQIRSGTAEVQ